MTSKMLCRCCQFPTFDQSFDYRSVIGKLGYLETGSRPDIAYIAHQCVRFMSNQCTEQGNAIRWLGRYLKRTCDKGLMMQPKRDHSLEVYVDAEFAGNWDLDKSDDVHTARLQHRYVIYYAG